MDIIEKRIETLANVLPDKLNLSSIIEILAAIENEDDQPLKFKELSKLFSKYFNGIRWDGRESKEI